MTFERMLLKSKITNLSDCFFYQIFRFVEEFSYRRFYLRDSQIYRKSLILQIYRHFRRSGIPNPQAPGIIYDNRAWQIRRTNKLSYASNQFYNQVRTIRLPLRSPHLPVEIDQQTQREKENFFSPFATQLNRKFLPIKLLTVGVLDEESLCGGWGRLPEKMDSLSKSWSIAQQKPRQQVPKSTEIKIRFYCCSSSSGQ